MLNKLEYMYDFLKNSGLGLEASYLSILIKTAGKVDDIVEEDEGCECFKPTDSDLNESESTGLQKKTAVIIKGNSKHIDNDTAHLVCPFYSKLKRILESEGYTVSFDPGLSFTTPKAADVWVGFSRGVGRLRFAPEGTTAIAIGSSMPNAINHPADAAWQKKYKHLDMRNILEKDRPPIPKEHLMITSSMERELRRRIRGRTEKTAVVEVQLERIRSGNSCVGEFYVE